MKKNILVVIFIIIGMIVVLNYNEHSLKKVIASCVVGQKRTSISFDIEKARKFCEEKIRKQRGD